MKCKKCGAEFEGNYCPDCGAKAEPEEFQPQQNHGEEYQAPPPPDMEEPTMPPNQGTANESQQAAPAQETKKKRKKEKRRNKKKKPFYLRWWFILLVIIVAVSAIGSFRNSQKNKIVWSDMQLGSMLPEPPSTKGEVIDNSMEILNIDFEKVSDTQYSSYLDACAEKGFANDAVKDTYSYKAFNTDGYSLKISYYSSNDEMSLTLTAPMEMSSITWPTGTAGKLLPAPKSMTGKFVYEYDDHFRVYIGDTPKADYDAYVVTCMDSGFTVDYDKDDRSYTADNADGCHVSVGYEGNNVMVIEVTVPDDSGTDQTENSTPETDTNTDTGTDTTADANTDTSAETDELDPDFKAAMDSYESFMDEYCAFMKKYQDSDGTDAGMLADYATYMAKYAKVCKDFAEWENEDMNDAETAYYIEVQTRVTQKLAEVSGS